MQAQIIIGFAILACVYAQVSQPPSYKEIYPDTYKFAKRARHARDLTWDKKVGNGKVFGTLGQTDDSLFGKAGYKQDIFNDQRGILKGEAYGSRVLGATGDSSYFGGKLDWANANKNAEATLELTKQIGGRTNAEVAASKVWNFDKNTRLSAGGTASQDIGHGKPDIGLAAKFRRFCKKEFNNKDLLVKHVTNCTVKKRRRACKSSREVTECDVCHKKMQKASLRMHKAIKHAGLGPVCEHCGKIFGNKFRLSEHYRAKHGYEKFKCNYCDFQSAGVMAMRNHERRHRGEKPFICETCGAKFHAAYLLAQHKQSHRTEKQFKCSQCPAAFKANNSLHMHRRACHSSARFSCAVCARAYSCRHYAVKHMRAVHRYTGPVPQLAQTN